MERLEYLVEKLRKEAGFEIFVGAGGREEELNDGIMRLRKGSNVYVRAVHNLRPEFVNYSSTSGLMLGPSPVMPPEARLRIDADNATELKVEDFSKRYCVYITLIGKNSPIPEKVRPYFTLNEILNTQDNGFAYRILIYIPAYVRDDFGRIGDFPTITLIAGKDLTERVSSHLLNFPQDFETLVRGILPKKDYPNVNKNILDVKRFPMYGIHLKDGTNGKILSVNYDFTQSKKIE